MRIAIIGAGNVGQSLAKGWTKAGHAIKLAVPDPKAARYQGLPKDQLATPAEAAATAEIIVLATPWEKTEAAIKGLGPLAGKIIIDCTNPLTRAPGGMSLSLGFSVSSGETVAQWAKGAAVFKTLNHTGADNMAAAASFKVKPVMFVAGDDAARKSTVMTLVGDLGFEPVDAGPLTNARLLEPLAMLWIDQAMIRGRGRDFAFALVRRG